MAHKLGYAEPYIFVCQWNSVKIKILKKLKEYFYKFVLYCFFVIDRSILNIALHIIFT